MTRLSHASSSHSTPLERAGFGVSRYCASSPEEKLQPLQAATDAHRDASLRRASCRRRRIRQRGERQDQPIERFTRLTSRDRRALQLPLQIQHHRASSCPESSAADLRRAPRHRASHPRRRRADCGRRAGFPTDPASRRRSPDRGRTSPRSATRSHRRARPACCESSRDLSSHRTV